MQLFTCDHIELTRGFIFEREPNSFEIRHLLRLGMGIYPNSAFITLVPHRPVTSSPHIVHKGSLSDVRGNKFADLIESDKKDETQCAHQHSYPPILVCIRPNNFCTTIGKAVPGSYKTLGGKPLTRLVGVDLIDENHFRFIETVLQINDGDIIQIFYGPNEFVLMHHNGFVARSSLLAFRTYRNPLSGMSEEFMTSCQRFKIDK